MAYTACFLRSVSARTTVVSQRAKELSPNWFRQTRQKGLTLIIASRVLCSLCYDNTCGLGKLHLLGKRRRIPLSE